MDLNTLREAVIEATARALDKRLGYVPSDDSEEWEEEYRRQFAALKQHHGGDLRPAAPRPAAPAGRGRVPDEKVLHVYPFGVNRARLEHTIRGLQLNAALATDLEGADAVLTIKNYYRRKPQPLRDAEASGIPIWVLRSNTQAQMEEALLKLLHGSSPVHEGRADRDMEGDPLEETEDAIQSVLDTSQPVDLTPQNSYIRRLQHQLAERFQLGSRSAGREPYRHVRIFKP
jgi:hypothetical protein